MPWLTVRENVRLALLDLARAAQDTAIIDLLQDVGLVDFAEALPRQLSGGMAQRVAIAIVLSDRIIVMRGQPGRIYRELSVDLTRPRRRTAPEFQTIKEEVIRALDLS